MADVNGPQKDRERDIERKVRNLYEHVPFPNYHVKLNARYLDRFRRLYTRVGLPLERFHEMHILDGGCGTGEEGLGLATLGGRSVTGFDMTGASLAIARRSARELGIANVRFVRGSLLAIPFRPESFDVVVSHGVIHHTGNPELALDNLIRVLKPGGYLSLFVYNSFGHFFNNVERAIVRRIAGSDLDRQVHVAKRLFRWRFKQDPYGPDLDAKLYDQYAHPHKSDHSIREVMGWFQRHGLEYQGSYPPVTAGSLIDALEARREPRLRDSLADPATGVPYRRTNPAAACGQWCRASPTTLPRRPHGCPSRRRGARSARLFDRLYLLRPQAHSCRVNLATNHSFRSESRRWPLRRDCAPALLAFVPVSGVLALRTRRPLDVDGGSPAAAQLDLQDFCLPT